MALLKLIQAKHFTTLLKILQSRSYVKYVSDIDIKKSYSILGISEDTDQEGIRSAYLELVKKFHPDSGQPEADSNKFHEIDKAFRILLTKRNKKRWTTDEIDFEAEPQYYDIKHTAPQHRQYLNYDGIGVGNIFERQKQYGKIRAFHAIDSIMNHRLNKAQADEKTLLPKKPQKHKIKTKYYFP